MVTREEKKPLIAHGTGGLSLVMTLIIKDGIPRRGYRGSILKKARKKTAPEINIEYLLETKEECSCAGCQGEYSVSY